MIHDSSPHGRELSRRDEWSLVPAARQKAGKRYRVGVGRRAGRLCPTAPSTAMTGAHLVPVGRTVPSRRTAFGGAVVFVALSVAAVRLRHWQRRSEERRVQARLSELDDHLLKDIGVTRADVIFGNVATLARRHQSHR
jgi:uncharacterized protein YjiS (DUF1127 family)